MSDSPPTAAQRFAALLLWLSLAVDAQQAGGRLARPTIFLILGRLGSIAQRFARLAARIAAGTYAPRHATTRRSPTARRPRQPNPLPQNVAWLIKLVPEAAPYGSQLQNLFADPEVSALLAAAPGPLRRPLRSLCRMLGVAPPPILAAPARPRPPPAAAQARPAGERRPPPLRRPQRHAAPPPTPRACGPPHPRPA